MTSTVLIIDDAETVRQCYTEILSDLPIQIEVAVNGKEALEIVEKQAARIRLIFVDINMPVMDGFGFLNNYRSLEIPQAPVVMISTAAREQDSVRAYQAGANLYLNKPVKPDDLFALTQLFVTEAV